MVGVLTSVAGCVWAKEAGAIARIAAARTSFMFVISVHTTRFWNFFKPRNLANFILSTLEFGFTIFQNMTKTPIHVAVTGAAGAIGYAILFRLASGEVFGQDQPLVLHLVDIEAAVPVMGGVILELEDCASPVLQKVIATADPAEGFRGVNWALQIGSVPRKPGMERKDLLAINGKIFTGM